MELKTGNNQESTFLKDQEAPYASVVLLECEHLCEIVAVCLLDPRTE